MSEVEKRIIIYALRYSLLRDTASPHDVRETILNNIVSFKGWELKDMIKEIKESYPQSNKSMINQWNIFIEELENII